MTSITKRLTLPSLHPIIFPLISLVVSFTCVSSNPYLGIVIPAVFSVVAILIFAFAQDTVYWMIMGLICFATSFYAITTYKHNIYQQHAFISQITRNSVTVNGIVTDKEYLDGTNFKLSITLKTNIITKEDGTKITKPYTIKLYLKDDYTIDIGNTIEYENIFISESANTYFQKILWRDDISGNAFVSHSKFKLLDRITPWRLVLKKTRSVLERKLKSKMSPYTYNLFASLFLGLSTEKFETMQQTKANFSYWGIAHYLARSGINVIIMILILEWLLKFIPLMYAIKQLTLCLALVLTTALTWTNISSLRAIICYYITTGFNLSKKPFTASHLILLTCFITLLINPFHVFFLNFQLSFGLSLALALIYETDLKIN